MEALNIALMQVQYEVLHESVGTIAQEHSISPEMVEYAIEQHNWVQKDLTNDEQNTAIDVVNSDHQVTLEAMHTLRQGVLDPHYIKIEGALVAKALSIINGIHASEPTAAKRLKEITEILSTLRPTKAMQAQTAQSDQGVKIMIMSHVGDVNAVESKREQIEVVIDAKS